MGMRNVRQRLVTVEVDFLLSPLRHVKLVVTTITIPDMILALDDTSNLNHCQLLFAAVDACRNMYASLNIVESRGHLRPRQLHTCLLVSLVLLQLPLTQFQLLHILLLLLHPPLIQFQLR